MGRWIVTSAWPYVNHMIHLGNLIGSLLSADVFARYLRLRGEDVIFVTGSDQHGTPIEVEAIKQGVEPEELAMRNHQRLAEILERFRISTDNYTFTHNPIHMDFVREFYMKIYRNGHIFEREEEALYCPKDGIFLPDRFVVGTCPYCGYEKANGDQCESCKRLLTPTQLIEPKCEVCGSRPVVKTTKHWYFDLPKFTEGLREFITGSETLSENAKTFSLQMIEQGLAPRSVTRDNRWGIPAPFPGAEGKTIYVWMEAVLGYVSAVIEYFSRKGDPEEWKRYWFDEDTRVMFFIGKDNIPFHTIIFPALLLATGDPYTLKFYVAATEFLMFEGQKFSKSKKVGIWLDEALELLPPDYWRYALLLIRPEVRDTNFTWSLLESAVNDDLNDQLGNLVMRIFALVDHHLNGQAPKCADLVTDDRELLDKVMEVKKEVEKLFEEMRIQRALVRVIELVRECNHHLNRREPWRFVKTDPNGVRSCLSALLSALKAVAIMLYPFIPDFSEKTLRALGADPREVKWDDIGTPVEEGTEIRRPTEPPFRKIDKRELIKRLDEMRKQLAKTH